MSWVKPGLSGPMSWEPTTSTIAGPTSDTCSSLGTPFWGKLCWDDDFG